MKQGLFANCYSTIHGQNLNTYTYTYAHTYAHTHTGQEFCGFEESLSPALFCCLLTLPEVDHKQRLRYLYCI